MAHTVQRGETLTEVSTRYRSTVDQLRDANPDITDPDHLHVGQTVRVPIGEGYGIDPIERQVQPGETLADLAAQYRQPPVEVQRANRHAVGPADPLVVGQKIWIPGTRTPDAALPGPTPTPLDAKVQATDAAVQRVAEAQRQHDDMNASTQGRGAAMPWLSDNLARARDGLGDAVRAEVTERAGAGADDAAWQRASEAVAARYAGDPANAERVTAALDQVALDRRTDAIVDTARAAGSPDGAARALGDQYAKAPPEVQAALRVHDGARQVVDDAAAWALAPLAAPADGLVGPQAPGREAMARLDAPTKDLDPAVAARVVSAAVPALEQHIAQYQSTQGGQPFGPEGMQHLVTALGRVADAPGGAAAIDRIAAHGLWDDGGVATAIGQGAHPAYALALARQPGMDAARVMDAVQGGLSMFRDKMDADVQAYGAHMDELSWLVNQHGGSMTAEQLDRAIADYQAEKGDAWVAQAEALRQQLVDNGEALLTQMAAVSPLPDGLGDHQARLDATLETLLGDTSAQLSISTALQAHPEFVSGERGQRLLEFVTATPLATSAKVGDQLRKLSQELATAHVKATVFSAVGTDFDPANPASVQRATDALESLRANTAWAKAMGLDGASLNKTIDALENTIPKAGESADDVAQRLKALDTQLDGLKGFDKSTFKGQMLRGVGLALAGVGFLASVDRAQMDPSLKNQLRVIVDAAGLGQRGFELWAGMTGASSSSTVGRLGGSLASKLMGGLTAAFDAWSAAESFAKGDVASGVLYGVGAGGGLLAALGTGSLAGPIGIGLVVVSAIGLAVVANAKEANKHEYDSDHGVSFRFLQHAGFDAEAARALVDQSGDGHSVVPLLERYAEAKGLDLGDAADRDRYVAWVNAIGPDELAALRDNLHRTIDAFEGDASRLTATAEDDAWIVRDTAQRPWFAVSGAARPESAAQVDAVLDVLNVPALG